MREVNLELLLEPEPFVYAWGRKGFRVTITIVSVLGLIAAVIAGLRSSRPSVAAILVCILLFALVEAAIVSLGLSIYKALNRGAALREIVRMGTTAELYRFADDDESGLYEDAFLFCIQALERGRGRPWLGGGAS